MTAQTLTLADFLLARIAEQGEGLCDERCHEDDPAMRFALADLESKRRLIETHALVASLMGRCGHPGCDEVHGPTLPPTCQECAMTSGPHGCWTLMLLALPYADHPDCREEWRA